MLNVLYGMLTNGVVADDPYEWYNKSCDNPLHTAKADEIRAILLTDIPQEKVNFFASVICNFVWHTEFGDEIYKLDSNNTYHAPSRPAMKKHSDDAYTFNQLTVPAEKLTRVRTFLDEDIESRLTGKVWLDYMAAGCLQMLREVYK